MGFALLEPYQSSKYLVRQTNKHLLELVRAILLNSFPRKNTWSSPRKIFRDGQVFKLLKQGSETFLEHFQLFLSSHSIDLMQITSSDLYMFSLSLTGNI